MLLWEEMCCSVLFAVSEEVFEFMWPNIGCTYRRNQNVITHTFLQPVQSIKKIQCVFRLSYRVEQMSILRAYWHYKPELACKLGWEQ